MNTSTRWTVAVMVVVVALGVALWTRLGDDSSPTGSLGREREGTTALCAWPAMANSTGSLVTANRRRAGFQKYKLAQRHP